MPRLNLYETDFYAWTQEQANLLRNKQWNKIDLANLIEEIECLGKQQRQELRNRLSIIIGYLLKWEYQAKYRSRSWLATIRVQRLKPYLDRAIQEAYENSRDLAMAETNLPEQTFPLNCPYNSIEILQNCFYLGNQAN